MLARQGGQGGDCTCWLDRAVREVTVQGGTDTVCHTHKATLTPDPHN
jgi:hypothetical protein